jgi:hypothetical protein
VGLHVVLANSPAAEPASSDGGSTTVPAIHTASSGFALN